MVYICLFQFTVVIGLINHALDAVYNAGCENHISHELTKLAVKDSEIRLTTALVEYV
jgi:hypothetical protein